MTSSPFYSFSRRLVVAGLAVAGAIAVLAPVDASAQHRARMGRSLAKQLADGGGQVSIVIEAPQAEVDRLARAYGLRVHRRLGMGAALQGSAAQLERLAADANVTSIAADDIVMSTMAVSSQSTGASLLWEASEQGRRFGGLTGAGIGVAVLDSGISQHSDVSRRVRLAMDFTGEEDPSDEYGHGTHVAGIIAGSGAGSRTAEGSQYVGMAPGAELLSLRVLGADGTGSVSTVIEALEWVLANKDAQKIRVVNLSLGHATTNDYRDDPLGRAVERLVRAGIVVVSSAGNLGKTEDGTPVIGMVVSPGFTPGALTVGALNTKGTVARSDDGVATYSSRGPVGDPDDPSTWIIKPDLVAPGNAIVSAGAQGSYLWDNYPSRRVIGENGGTYLVLSGSSMATAVTSGAVAQLLQLQPQLTPAEVKFALQFTAQRLNDFGLIEQGAGSLNVPLAAALVESRGGPSAPESVGIAGEFVGASKIAFSSGSAWAQDHPNGNSVSWGRTIVPGNRIAWGGTTVWGLTIIWGNRGVSGLRGDTIIWGNRGQSPAWSDSLVWGSTIIWGNRGGGGLGGSTIIWGNRGGGLGGDTIIWGNRGGGGLGGDTIIWGNRGGGGLGGDTIIWGNRGGGGLSGDTIIWGNRGESGGSAVVWGDTIIWGNRGGGGVGGDTIIWGNRGTLYANELVDAQTIIWGNRNGGLRGDTIIWGNRGGQVQGDTIIWGNRRP
jgi:serine protease AprX